MACVKDEVTTYLAGVHHVLQGVEAVLVGGAPGRGQVVDDQAQAQKHRVQRRPDALFLGRK